MLTTEIQTINSFYLEKEAEFADLFNTRYAQEVKDMVLSLACFSFDALSSQSNLLFSCVFLA